MIAKKISYMALVVVAALSAHVVVASKKVKEQDTITSCGDCDGGGSDDKKKD